MRWAVLLGTRALKNVARLIVCDWLRGNGTGCRLWKNSLQYVLVYSFDTSIYFDLRVQTADKAQQAFSYSSIPTLCNAVPALEKLYATWENNATCQKQNRLKYHWMPHLKRLMTTIKKHRTQMRILWRCVRIFIVLHCNELMIWNWIQSSIRNVKWGISKRIGPENYKKRFSRWRKPL